MWSYNQNHQNSFNWVIFRGYLHEGYEKSPQINSVWEEANIKVSSKPVA